MSPDPAAAAPPNVNSVRPLHLTALVNDLRAWPYRHVALWHIGIVPPPRVELGAPPVLHLRRRGVVAGGGVHRRPVQRHSGRTIHTPTISCPRRRWVETASPLSYGPQLTCRVQIHWSSAYDGFGTGSLDRDCDELGSLVAHLRANGVHTVVLMGHSTGSQAVLRYLSQGQRPEAQGGILQSPASDREFFAADPDDTNIWKLYLPRAEALIAAGKGDQLLDDEFTKETSIRMTAHRLHSLVGLGLVHEAGASPADHAGVMTITSRLIYPMRMTVYTNTHCPHRLEGYPPLLWLFGARRTTVPCYQTRLHCFDDGRRRAMASLNGGSCSARRIQSRRTTHKRQCQAISSHGSSALTRRAATHAYNILNLYSPH